MKTEKEHPVVGRVYIVGFWLVVLFVVFFL